MGVLLLIISLFFVFRGLNFEKAYCEYRLNKTNEALKTLREVEKPDYQTQELLAQVVSMNITSGKVLEFFLPFSYFTFKIIWIMFTVFWLMKMLI